MKIAVLIYYSDITTKYNFNWVSQCLRSIKNQTHQDFVIFENNYESHFSMVKLSKLFEDKEYYFFDKKHKNYVQSLNFLMKKAFDKDFEAVININIDDYYDNNYFKKCIEYSKNNDLVSSKYCLIKDNKIIKQDINTKGEIIIGNILQNINCIIKSGVFITKRYYDNVGHFEELIPIEHKLYWKAGVRKHMRFNVIPEYLIFYRIHKNQSSSKIFS